MACANGRSWHRARRGAVALVPVPLCHRAAAMTRAETVIVGGGPAGSATACGLAALGRDVVLIERTAGPHLRPSPYPHRSARPPALSCRWHSSPGTPPLRHWWPFSADDFKTYDEIGKQEQPYPAAEPA